MVEIFRKTLGSSLIYLLNKKKLFPIKKGKI